MSDARADLTAALAGRYTLDRELGAGGMATVYLATDVKHNRKVAVDGPARGRSCSFLAARVARG